jgi:osmotically-inducible protein OsmY
MMSDSDLQREIQNALSKEPTLSGDTVNVTVSGDNIETTGSVNSAKEKLTASRIVQSFAGNRKVVNHITVGHGTSPASSSTRESSDDHRPANANTNPNPSNPEPNKGQPPAGSSPPPQ